MKATVVIDNIKKNDLISEWGLCIYIEYKGSKILLDTGASNKYLTNAKDLGIDIESIDFGVLSHAHYDHALGLDAFFKNNTKAPFYIRKESAENCYGSYLIFKKYIGLRKGCLKDNEGRFVYADGDYEIVPGVTLIPHKTPGLDAKGKKAGMYVKVDRKYYPDSFAHEQSLVFDTDKGLVIFNSCSHGGADNIIKEVRATYPDKKIYALIGGFHLFSTSKEDVKVLADSIKETGIEKIYTGHCTGQKSYNVLHEELGDITEQIYTGMVIDI